MASKEQVAEPASDYRQRKQDRRRRQVLDAAAAVFADMGFYTATMKDIADRLEMRPGSLYHYLDSKEAALEEICRDGARDFHARLAAISEQDIPTADMVAEGIRNHLTGDRRDYVVNFAFSRRNLPVTVVGELNDMARAYRRQWVKILARGRDRGEWRAGVEPDVAVDVLLALCNGVAASLVHKSEAAVAKTVETATEIYLAGILEN